MEHCLELYNYTAPSAVGSHEMCNIRKYTACIILMYKAFRRLRWQLCTFMGPDDNLNSQWKLHSLPIRRLSCKSGICFADVLNQIAFDRAYLFSLFVGVYLFHTCLGGLLRPGRKNAETSFTKQGWESLVRLEDSCPSTAENLDHFYTWCLLLGWNSKTSHIMLFCRIW